MVKIVSKLKTKEIEPNIYALCFKNDDSVRKLAQVIAYSLEEAIDKGLTKLSINNPVMPEMYTTLTMKDLSDDVLVSSLVDEVADEKNALMNQIIRKKDRSLLNRKKTLFTIAEAEYIDAEITKSESL